MNERRRTRIVLGGLLALALVSACKRDGSDPVAPAEGARASGSNAEASPVEPPRSGSAVAKAGSRLFFASTGDAGFQLPPVGAGSSMTVDVVGEQEGRLVVETLVSEPATQRCAAARDGLAGLRLRLYVAPDALLNVPTDEHEHGDGTVRDPCAEADFMGTPGRQSYEVKAGAAIVWADGHPAGTVTAAYRFMTAPRDEGGRTCFDAPLSVDQHPTVTLCFAPGDVAEVPPAGIGPVGSGSDGGAGFGGRGKAVPQVHQAKAMVAGGLDKDIIRRIVRAHINEVRHCYTTGLARDPSLAGRVSLEFTIGPKGDVTVVKLVDSTLADAEVGNCIAKAVRDWTFPKPDGGGNVVVTYPFVLEPG